MPNYTLFMHSQFFLELAIERHQGFILALALIIAFAIDYLWGEPHFRIHPVVWMGNYLKKLGALIAPQFPEISKQSKIKHFIYGCIAWGFGAVMVGLTALILKYFILQLAWYWEALILGVLLKPLFAARMLFQEVQAVEKALTESLQAGQERLSWLCSRDVTQLDASQVRETAIETLAENLNDSVIAPIFWFFVLGLPGVAIYRFANTADAMWGYMGMRSGQHWTWAGKAAARIDDVLSWIPARLTALFIVVLGGGVKLKKLYQQAQITPSPNGGWPMGAMALVLNISLGKPGVYRLNPSAPAPLQEHLQSAVLLSQKVVLFMLLITSFALVINDYNFHALFI